MLLGLFGGSRTLWLQCKLDVRKANGTFPPFCLLTVDTTNTFGIKFSVGGTPTCPLPNCAVVGQLDKMEALGP